MAYWLFKTEPDVYSIDDLKNEAKGFGVWDGIRNYQARNLLRDNVAVGDHVLVYHSSCKPTGIVGTAKVIKSAYTDPAQFNPESPYYDPKSSADNPRWFCVDISFEEKFNNMLTLKRIKQTPELAEMVLCKQGRLSIQPVTPAEWTFLQQLQ